MNKNKGAFVQNSVNTAAVYTAQAEMNLIIALLMNTFKDEHCKQ